METRQNISLMSPAGTDEARYFLASIVESSKDSIVTVDFNNVITSWNKAAERLYGYPAAEVIGKPLTLVTLPDDVKQLANNIDRIKHRKVVERYETVRVHKDGRLINLEIELSPILNDSGVVIGVSTFARDITERKRIEADLVLLAEVSKNLVDLTDLNETLNAIGKKIATHFNLTHCHFVEINDRLGTGTLKYGWQRTGTPQISGPQPVSDFISDDFTKRSRAGETIAVRDVFTDPLTKGEQLAAIEIVSFVTVPMVRDGVWHFLVGFYDSQPRNWMEPEIALLRELATRIWIRLERAQFDDALRKSEKRLRELNAKLQETDKVKTAFFNNISHEFRTPLTLLVGPMKS